MATAPHNGASRCLRIAAAGDLHCDEHRAETLAASVAALEQSADLLLLAGDLTTLGEPEQVAPLAEACGRLTLPTVAVLGNHDFHANRTDELAGVLEAAGVHLLERDIWLGEAAGTRVGVVGLKGFVGGFAGSHLPDFGEPLLRRVYAETSEDVEALERGLGEVAVCPVRIVLLHYAPTADTIAGEPEGIWAFLGNDRLAAPIAQHEPDLVLHGHAHAGTFAGAIGSTPVYNVAVPVTGRDFWLFELDVPAGDRAPIH
ncbi:MAG TPA: metallophosphoesterase [Solirubrobacteraceae bacterium]|nr:metallophosphoesterase [Solirubrobacteraceae bacterium]